jgi:hypothetical protein
MSGVTTIRGGTMSGVTTIRGGTMSGVTSTQQHAPSSTQAA